MEKSLKISEERRRGEEKKRDMISKLKALSVDHTIENIKLTGSLKVMATREETTKPTREGGIAFEMSGRILMIPAHRAVN